MRASATRNGADVYLLVFVAEPDSIWRVPPTVVLVAEPAAMEGGKVTVAADRLRQGLAGDGRVAPYGL